MNEPKHTPGPWMIEPRRDNSDTLPDHVAISSEAHSAFAQVVWKMADEDRSPTCEANAHLIAAAPDLLAACKLALMAFERNSAIDWDDLRRAIEKADSP